MSNADDIEPQPKREPVYELPRTHQRCPFCGLMHGPNLLSIEVHGQQYTACCHQKLTTCCDGERSR